MLLCSELPINVDCFDEALKVNLNKPMRFNLALNLAATECLIDSKGCCSWHGGIDFYDENKEVFICKDGTESPTCRLKGEG